MCRKNSNAHRIISKRSPAEKEPARIVVRFSNGKAYGLRCEMKP